MYVFPSLLKCSAMFVFPLQTNVYPSITSTIKNVRNGGARSSFLTEYFSISWKHIFRLSTKQHLCQLYIFVNYQYRVFEKELPCYMQKLYGEINEKLHQQINILHLTVFFFFILKMFRNCFIIINYLCVKLGQQTPNTFTYNIIHSTFMLQRTYCKLCLAN